MTAKPSRTVGRVLKGQLCTGCGLCAAAAPGAIVVETASPGYSRPRQIGPVLDHQERVIAAACPGSVVESWPEAPNLHPYWGPWRRVATGWATDQTLRHRASSGGALTGLAVHALKSGMVDRVVHVVPDLERPTRNRVVCSTTEAEVIAGAGSRYAASSPLAVMDQVLSDGGRVAFIGKPCDASALRRLARIDKRVDQHIAFILAFFCAGVPSHAGADRVIAAMGMDPAEVSRFRYRGFGWPGLTVAEDRNGTRAEMTYAESWGGHLSHEIQFRCKICSDAVGGVADIAFADAWYGDSRGYPSFEEHDGRSLIMTRTEAGESLLGAALEAGAIDVRPLDVGEIEAMQPSQARRKRLVWSRLAALSATLQSKPDVRGTEVPTAAWQAGGGEQIKSFLGSVRRIVVARR
jgi:coenzyme F420 hydrogenase subunit beta